MPFMPETTAATDRALEVQQEFAKIEETAQHIDKCVNELETRLGSSILAQRRETQGAAGGPSAPEPVRVPLAQKLYEHGRVLERIREHLSSMLDRIEA